MINNGGFTVVFVRYGSGANRFVDVVDWVHLVTPAIVLSESTLAVTEGGSSATYTVSLSARPTGGVKVRVARGNGAISVNKSGGTAGASQDLDFTTGNWNSAQTITVAAVDDSNAVSGDVTISHTTVDANTVAEYDSASKNLTVTVTDDDGEMVVSRSGALALPEGDDATYNVKLKGQPASDVVVRVTSGDGAVVTVNKSGGTAGASQDLTFTNSNWNTNQAITLSAAQDDDLVDPSAVTITHAVVDASSSNEFDDAADVTFDVNVSDDDTAAITVAATALSLNEDIGSSSNSGTRDVSLAYQPAGNVVVRVTSADVGAVTVNTGSGTPGASKDLTFTNTTWNTAQSVTLAAAQDDDAGDESVTITASVVDGQTADDNYDAASDETFTVSVTDDETKGVIISAGAATIAESGAGNSFTYTIKLRTEPTGTVTVTVNAPAGVATVDPSSLTFEVTDANGKIWSSTQTVTVTAVDDDVDDASDRTGMISHTSTGGDYATGVTIADVSVTLTDDDAAGVRVTPERSMRSTTEDDAGTVELMIALSSRPTADVTVTVTSSDTTEGRVKASAEDPDPTLDFTTGDWNTAQPVTVTGVDDEDIDGDVEYNIRLAFSSTDTKYTGLDPVDVAFTNLDDDLSILSVSGGGEVAEGDSGTTARAEFTVTLSPARRQAVSVSYATSDGTATAGSDYESATGTVTFSAGETSKTVAVTINGDDEAEGNETFTLGLTTTPNGQIDPQNSSAQAVITNDDEMVVAAGMSGEFPVGETTVTVESDLPDDTGLEVVLPSELERGGAAIEELTVTLGPTDAEIDGDLFGYTGNDEDHVLVDIDVSPVPDDAVRICLPITEGLRRAAGRQRLYLIRFSGGEWEELSSETEGGMVCADVRGFSPFAVVFDIDYAKRRVGEVNRAILPELTRAMTASTLEAITSRIGDAMTGGGTAGAFGAPSEPEPEYGRVEPGLRLGEFEDGETLSLLDAVNGSYYSVSLAGSHDPLGAEEGLEEREAEASRAGGLGLWISGDYRSLSGEGGGLVDWDGRVISGHLGADYRFGRSFLAGVATSWSQGSFDYTGRGEGSARVSGDYGSRMNSFHPYLGLSLSRRLNLWAAGGWGFGEIRIDDGEITGRQRASTRLGTLATGADLMLLGGDASSLSLKGEAWISRVKVKDDGGRIEGLRVKTNRLRAALEGSHALGFGSGSSLVPSLEFAIRRDGGDGETGVGGELGGGVALVSSWGLTVEARGRGLLFHQGDAKEWGVGGSVRFDPGGDERGLSMSVIPSWGDSASGVQSLWESEAVDVGSSGAERSLSLETEVGYGIPALGDRGLLTPYGAFGRTGGDGRSYRAGSRLSMGGTFDVSLEGLRTETGAGDPEHGLTLQGRLNW